MAVAFSYRCPNTGLKAQGWIAEDPTERPAEKIIEALGKQLAAAMETTRRLEGYRVELTIPLRAAPKHESIDSRG